ncbi:MAG: hypothetical protein ACYC1D_18710 [Acidimicrobiales bacterium]
MLVWEVVEWDEHDEAHATRHGVSVAEIEQILAEGTTDGGRRLRVVVAYDPVRRVLRPIAAWEMR